MVVQREGKAGHEARIGMAILIAVFSLPAVNPDMIGWLCGLVPLPVFYYLICLGRDQGFTIIRNAILLSGGIALLFGSLPLLIFSLTLVPLGFVFFQSAQQKKTPAQTGFNGILVLGAVWLLFWAGYGAIRHINPYEVLLFALDEGLTRALGMYLEQSELPATTIKSFEIAIEQLRIFIPRVLPALLVTGILYTVWMNQALGNWLLKKRDESLAPWQDFQKWQLPDKLIWGIIFGGASLLFLTPPLNTLGLNIVIIWGALYFLQGLAVLVSLLHRWALPMPLRILIYAFMFIQSIGVIVLSFMGLTDTWADYRKLNPKPKSNNDSEAN